MCVDGHPAPIAAVVQVGSGSARDAADPARAAASVRQPPFDDRPRPCARATDSPRGAVRPSPGADVGLQASPVLVQIRVHAPLRAGRAQSRCSCCWTGLAQTWRRYGASARSRRVWTQVRCGAHAHSIRSACRARTDRHRGARVRPGEGVARASEGAWPRRAAIAARPLHGCAVACTQARAPRDVRTKASQSVAQVTGFNPSTSACICAGARLGHCHILRRDCDSLVLLCC
jgi:hypothetical protein